MKLLQACWHKKGANKRYARSREKYCAHAYWVWYVLAEQLAVRLPGKLWKGFSDLKCSLNVDEKPEPGKPDGMFLKSVGFSSRIQNKK